MKMVPLMGSVLVLLKKEGYHVFVSFNNTELEIKKLQCKLIKERQVLYKVIKLTLFYSPVSNLICVCAQKNYM